jgi:hypothetical protein
VRESGVEVGIRGVRVGKETSKIISEKFGCIDLALTFALPIENGVSETGMRGSDLRGKSS